MKALPTSAMAVLLLLAPCAGRTAGTDSYTPGPDSLPQPGVPKGELFSFDLASPEIFPGTIRKVTVYVPRQYDPARAACVFVDQDGVQWDAPVVLDNLIARGEVPVMVGVFVTPGVVPARNPAAELPRFNRSLEYDGLGDDYARLILNLVLPEVERRRTADGRPIRLSHDGNDRAIAGGSSGAIAAFTAAWEHPEAFSRVISSIGTYVGLRGGDRYPTLVRKCEPKPIRVFLQDGSNDLNIYGGDWWMANQTMERALVFAGYEVNHVFGDGSHSGKHIASILPDAMRWVWKDWPRPVARGTSKNGALAALLIPGEEWRLSARVSDFSGASVNAKGEMHLYPVPENATSSGGPRVARARQYHRLGPDGRLYRLEGSRVVATEPSGKPDTVLADGIAGFDLVVAHNGNVYVTEPGDGEGGSRVWLVTAAAGKKVVDRGLRQATGVALSPDQSLLYVADGQSHWIYSYQIQGDGTLADRQRYYWLHCSDSEDASHAGGMCCDRAGWLYVATDLGVQVCDQAGRVNAILPTPEGGATGVFFAGDRFDALFAQSRTALYERRLNTSGANPWAEPVLPPAPRL